MPRIKIPLNDRSLPPDYVFGPSSYAEVLFSAKITAWTEVNYAQGYVVLQYIIIVSITFLVNLCFSTQSLYRILNISQKGFILCALTAFMSFI